VHRRQGPHDPKAWNRRFRLRHAQQFRIDALCRLQRRQFHDAQAALAHEARHALDEVDPNGPPPPTQLFEVMAQSSTQFIGLADAELRAYLGELHDTGSTACWVLTKMMRGVYGRSARRTPHFYATLTIVAQLDPDPEHTPEARLATLCDLPDAEVRRRVAGAWQKLYGAPLAAGQRATAGP